MVKNYEVGIQFFKLKLNEKLAAQAGHLSHTVPKIRFTYSPKWNCVASFPIPTIMYLSAIYIFPGSVCLFVSSKIGRSILGIHKSLTDTWMWKMEDRTLFLCFGNSKDEQYHFWEYINRKQTFFLDSHRPFICSGCSVAWFRIRNFAVVIL